MGKHVREVSGKRVLTIAAVVAMAAILSAHGATHSLKALIDALVKDGLDARLPAHLSVILGVAPVERATAVKQAVIRDGHTVHTFNVCVTNHGDVVILTHDDQSRATKAYLVSAAGELRKAVSYQPGAPANERTLLAAGSDFSGELKFWSEYQRTPAKPK
jgi:hypothetical protein